jgi:hypothetical protein
MVRLSAEEGHHWNKTTKPDEEEPPRPQTVGDTKSRDSFHRMYRLAQPKFDRVSLDKDVGELFSDSGLDWGKAIGFEQPSILKKNKNASSNKVMMRPKAHGLDIGIAESNSKLSVGSKNISTSDDYIDRKASWISNESSLHK